MVLQDVDQFRFDDIQSGAKSPAKTSAEHPAMPEQETDLEVAEKSESAPKIFAAARPQLKRDARCTHTFKVARACPP